MLMWKTVKLSLALTFVALVVAFGGALGFALGEDDGGGAADSATVPNSSAEFGILDEIADILREDFVNPGIVAYRGVGRDRCRRTKRDKLGRSGWTRRRGRLHLRR